MPTSINSSTGLYSGSQNFMSGNLSHFRITFKNRDPDDHLRWPGKIRAGDNMRKGVRYTVTSVAEADKNVDYSENIGYKDFSETNGEGGFYRTMTPVPDGVTGEIPRGHSFIADDGDDTNPPYVTEIIFPETDGFEPDDDLTPGETYTISKLGGAPADNPFAAQFADVDANDTIEVGFSFTVASEADSGNAAYEADHFDATNFDSGTKLVRGSKLTELAFGSDYFDDGDLEPNNAVGRVIDMLQTFASVVQVGPIVPIAGSDPKAMSFVVVLENWYQDPTVEVADQAAMLTEAGKEIRRRLNSQIDKDLRSRERITAGNATGLKAGTKYGIVAFDPDDSGSRGDVVSAWSALGLTGVAPAVGLTFMVPGVKGTDPDVDFTDALYGASSQVIYAREDMDADVEVEAIQLV